MGYFTFVVLYFSLFCVPLWRHSSSMQFDALRLLFQTKGQALAGSAVLRYFVIFVRLSCLTPIAISNAFRF